MEKKITFYFNILLLSLLGSNSLAQDVNFDWAVKLGGSGIDYGHSITADASGNVYTSGIFRGIATFGTYSLTSVGSANGFITKQDAEGDVLWAKQLVSTGHTQAYGITADASGNIYATGAFLGVTTFDSHILTPPVGNNRAMFVAKYDTDGNVVWIKQFDGNETGFGTGNEIKTDALGNIYVAGHFTDTITFGSTVLASEGGTDGFITKHDSNGNVLWAKKIGGVNDSYAQSISVDGLGNVYTAGFFNGVVDVENHTLTSVGQNDFFISKHDSNGDIAWVQQVGGTGYDEAVSIATDVSGNIYATGHFEDVVVFGTHTLTAEGNRDGFIIKYDSDGNVLWVNQMRGTGTDNTHSVGVVVDVQGNAYITGIFGGTVSFDSYTYSSSGGIDGFVAGYNTDGDAVWAKHFGGTEQDRANSIHVNLNGTITVTGDFYSVVDFDPSDDVYTLTANGINADVFVLQFSPSTVGINDQNVNNSINIYPNPANNFVTIANIQSNSTIRITDMIGKVVYEEFFVADTQITINTTEFVNGIYLLEIEYKGNITDNKRIVVNK